MTIKESRSAFPAGRGPTYLQKSTDLRRLRHFHCVDLSGFFCSLMSTLESFKIRFVPLLENMLTKADGQRCS